MSSQKGRWQRLGSLTDSRQLGKVGFCSFAVRRRTCPVLSRSENPHARTHEEKKLVVLSEERTHTTQTRKKGRRSQSRARLNSLTRKSHARAATKDDGDDETTNSESIDLSSFSRHCSPKLTHVLSNPCENIPLLSSRAREGEEADADIINSEARQPVTGCTLPCTFPTSPFEFVKFACPDLPLPALQQTNLPIWVR